MEDKKLTREEELSKVQTDLRKAEELAEDILCDKQDLVELDRKRNANRESLRELRRGSLKEEDKVWMFVGSAMFLRLDHGEAESLVERDMRSIDAECAERHSRIKKKTAQLMALKGRDDQRSAADSFLRLKPIHAHELLDKYES